MANKNVWDPDWDISDESAQQLIYSQFPQLSAYALQRLGHGWDNTVFLVGGKYVFRFPRRELAVDLIHLEGRLLPKLDGLLTLPYPKPLFYGKGTSEYPPPFLGYTYVKGSFPQNLADEQREKSAKKLGQFLRRLHSFPVQIARENGAPEDHRKLMDIPARKEKMQVFLSRLGSQMEEKERAALADYFNQLSTDPVRERNVFSHGDLHFKNVLVDEQGDVSGIIDWGDMSVGHAAGDLSIGYSFLPPRARHTFFAEYGEVDEDTKRLARMMAIYIPMLVWLQAVDDGDKPLAQEAKVTIARALDDEESHDR
ncbi:phosphotransferase [Brevibacillus nitrificans]|uniref:phosphotransferase n=1 Tax=Brevibacillus nitrificans TaxID=651560 RepID=UPI002E1D5F27|nr:phosphotransferase [Brevibacillus nitrificans]